MPRPALQYFFGLFSRRRRLARERGRAAPGFGDVGALKPPAAPSPSLNSLLNVGALVEDARLAQGPSGEWVLRILLSRACPRLEIHVDHWVSTRDEQFNPWQARQRLLLTTRTDLVLGQTYELPVMARTDGQGERWRWLEDGSDGTSVPPVRSRGRFAFVPDGGSEQRLYYVLLWPRSRAEADGPMLVDETLFRFKDAWEAEAPLTERPRWRGR